MVHNLPVKNTVTKIKLSEVKDISKVTAFVSELAKQLGMASFEAGLVSSAASEIVTNAIRYGSHGEAIISMTDNQKGITIKVSDRGSGISNIDLAMQDGYSTFEGTSLGLGLAAAKRSVDEMVIDTSPSGTSITLRKYLGVHRKDIDVGMASFPAVGMHFNGDGYLVKGYEGDKMFLAILDGAGKGERAYKSTTVILKLFEKNFRLPLDELIVLGHEELLKYKGKRAVELAMLRITPFTIESVILGNTTIHANAKPYISLPIQNGSVGLSIPKSIHVHRIKRPDAFSVVMHTDGIEHVNYEEAFIEVNSAQKIAEHIFNNHALTDDDATILVVSG